MLIINISTNDGLCNGNILRITDFLENFLKWKILTGAKADNTVFLNRIT